MYHFHEAGIIHTDMKPDNVFFLPNKEMPGNFNLRIIDLDFCILADTLAPWNNKMGYVGTPMYLSPEHVRAPDWAVETRAKLALRSPSKAKVTPAWSA